MKSELIGYDENGRVFMTDSIVLREIRNSYKPMVIELYRIYQERRLENIGIVGTRILPNHDLEHEKIVVSYPYEWTASMFKDALIFHINLFIKLKHYNLTLKDALPNNILFNRTKPVFVDFLSLVFRENLINEKWLEQHKAGDIYFAVFKTMLLPFFIIPLYLMSNGDYKLAREILSVRSCNSGGKQPTLKEVYDSIGKKSNSQLISKCFYFIKLIFKIWCVKKGLFVFDFFLRSLLKDVTLINVEPLRSAYSKYYDQKKENNSIDDINSFTVKQKTIHSILIHNKPSTVLDIGANTGWYSILSSKLGAEVIAIEEDESCVDILYNNAKEQGFPILPLKMSFRELENEIFGINYLEEIYKGRSFDKIPLYQRATARLTCDLVLILGLTHHLVLGEGFSIQKIFEILSKLTKSTLVLEFIDLNDEKILAEPSFFKSLEAFNPENYNLNKFVDIGKKYFKAVEIFESNPTSRKILVYEK